MTCSICCFDVSRTHGGFLPRKFGFECLEYETGQFLREFQASRLACSLIAERQRLAKFGDFNSVGLYPKQQQDNPNQALLCCKD